MPTIVLPQNQTAQIDAQAAVQAKQATGFSVAQAKNVTVACRSKALGAASVSDNVKAVYLLTDCEGFGSPGCQAVLSELVPSIAYLQSGMFTSLKMDIEVVTSATNAWVTKNFPKALRDWAENPPSSTRLQLSEDADAGAGCAS